MTPREELVLTIITGLVAEIDADSAGHYAMAIAVADALEDRYDLTLKETPPDDQLDYSFQRCQTCVADGALGRPYADAAAAHAAHSNAHDITEYFRRNQADLDAAFQPGGDPEPEVDLHTGKPIPERCPALPPLDEHEWNTGTNEKYGDGSSVWTPAAFGAGLGPDQRCTRCGAVRVRR